MGNRNSSVESYVRRARQKQTMWQRLTQLLFAGVGSSPVQIDLGLPVLRIAIGGLLCTVFEKFLPREGVWGPQPWFINDVAKMGFPLPTFFAWCAVLAEFFGGILLIFGLMTRPAALVNAVTTFVAAFIFHKAQVGGPALLGTVFFAATTTLLLTGPGRLSIDYLLSKNMAAPPNRAKPDAAADGGGL